MPIEVGIWRINDPYTFTKLRNRFTLKRLGQRFGLEG